MCYSELASKRALQTSMVSCVFLYYLSTDHSYKLLALFFSYVSLMQLYDWIFWTTESKSVNKVVTKLAMISNNFQPTILGLLIYFYKSNMSATSTLVLKLYTFLSFVYSVWSFNKISVTKVTDESTPSLYWQWNNLEYSDVFYVIFLATMSFFAYSGFSYPLNMIMVFINIVSFTLSDYYYKNIDSIGRLWCYYASYIPSLLLILGVRH